MCICTLQALALILCKSCMMVDRPLRFCTPHPGIEWQHLSRVRWKDNTPLSTVAESGCPSDQHSIVEPYAGCTFEMCELHAGALRSCALALSGCAGGQMPWEKSRTELDPLPATATNNPRFRHHCVWNHNSACKYEDLVPSDFSGSRKIRKTLACRCWRRTLRAALSTTPASAVPNNRLTSQQVWLSPRTRLRSFART